MLCDQLTAALGKIDIEVAELKPKEIMEDWVEYLRGQCMENELLAFNVRKKGKSLKGCIAALLMWIIQESADPWTRISSRQQVYLQERSHWVFRAWLGQSRSSRTTTWESRWDG